MGSARRVLLRRGARLPPRTADAGRRARRLAHAARGGSARACVPRSEQVAASLHTPLMWYPRLLAAGVSGASEPCRRGGARGLPRQPQLRVDVREVALHRAAAEEQPLRDLLVAEAGGHQPEHVALALAELGEVGRRRARSLVVAQERANLGEERVPGRLTLLEDVVVALERDEAGIRQERRQAPALLVWDGPVVAGVQDERRLHDPTRGIGDLGLRSRQPEPRGHLAAARRLLHVVVPAPLLLAGARDVDRAEHLAERGNGAAPPDADQLDQQAPLLG